MMLGKCGIDCDLCEAKIATETNDDSIRQRLAKEWSEFYQSEIDPSEINCTGCNVNDGIFFSHCKVCKLRLCGEEKEIERCTQCKDYECKNLSEFLEQVPEARANLEKVQIVDFLIKAKKATYAGNGDEDIPSRPNSHDLSYERGDYQYIDTYVGSYKFSGQEALFKKQQAFWTMNYIGRVLDEGFEGDFLKEALSIIPEDKPFRGPDIYQNNDMTYTCQVHGDFDWFNGYECIYKGSQKIYECVFHGGAVQE